MPKETSIALIMPTITQDLHYESLTGRKPARHEHPLETQMTHVKLTLQRYPSYTISDAPFYKYGGSAIKIDIKR